MFRAAKYYRLSADMKNASAENSFGICLERGIGVQKNLFLAAQYYHRAAQQGHPDGANNFGFCLEHGRGVEQDIEMAAEYYKFASDHGHSEAKLNHKRCLRLLGSWEPPDRSSDIVSHPPSVDFLCKLFGDFLENPKPLDDDDRRLLSSFDRLRTPTEMPVISRSLTVEWVLDEIGSGDSSVVKLSFDSKSKLTAVKTSSNPKYAKLIQRESAILKTLKHPLIVELRNHICETREHNSVIVTEFARNGSLTNHLSSSKYRLKGANRITKIIVGIALGMRYLHSKSIIHRHLTPDNILLDWNWNVRIADFGQSSSPATPISENDWLSINSRYLAPECYDNCCFLESDVFSFGIILYELVTGEPAFSEELTGIEIGFKVAIRDERPTIPKFVLPSVQELINNCWTKEPEDRPSFEEIVNCLVKMKFKVMPNVNSSKLSEFVKKIEDWEAN
jgi:hypothetical protein